ncbi:MAG TPA: AAA family ATPase [Solirubrobacteraceae bacterium]
MTSGLQQAIFDWTLTLPAWQRDLARRLSINDRLSEGDVEELAALLLADGAEDSRARPLELDDLPSDDGAETPVELIAMGDMNNINSLAPGQRLRFAPGLTVVYGDTGAGKSGHTRLLRRSCRSVERGEVLPDVFDPGAVEGAQTATVVARVGDQDRDLQLDLAERPPRVLSSVSVFDAACARIYVEQSNVVDLVPRPLVLFDRLVRAQNAIAEHLREESRALSSTPPEVAAFAPTSEVGQLLGQLGAADVDYRLRALAKLTDVERTELDALIATEAEIRSNRSAELEASARRTASAARNARTALDDALRTVDDGVLDQARMLRRRRDETVAAQRRLAGDALADAPVPGTGDEAWKALWEAARNVAVSRGSTFPDTGDDARCELCQQTLDEDARRRMTAFETYVRDDLEASLGELRQRAHAMARTAPDAKALRDQVNAWLAAIDDDALNATVAATLDVYVARRAALLAILSGETPPTPDAAPTLDALDLTIERQTTAAAGHAALRDDAKRRALLSRLAKLRDRAHLGEHLGLVLRHVQSRRRGERIKAALRELDTQKISLTQRRLGAQVITDELRDAVAEELAALTPDPPRVTVSGSSRKGQTVIRLELDADRCSHSVAQVLSDGEQRALSTAFFLAELRVGANRSAIVLDDPVTSLDQTRREYVARRLVREARARQVIVFTHDLAFLLLLQEQARLDDVPCHGQTLLRAGGRIGLARNELPFEGLSPQKRLKELRSQLDGLARLDREGHLGYPGEAERWCVQLRQTWEQTIEEIVLGGVVRRFIPAIEPKRLRDVVVDEDIKERVARAMERTSPWAHFRAPSLALPARTPEQLTEMATELAELHTLLDPNKRRALRVVPPAAARTGAA